MEFHAHYRDGKSFPSSFLGSLASVIIKCTYVRLTGKKTHTNLISYLWKPIKT